MNKGRRLIDMTDYIVTQLEEIEEFIHNEYFEKYKNLIIANKNLEYKSGATHKHHVIPRAYYKCKNLPVDNTSCNMVNLSIKDHIRAHIYLSKCVAGNSDLQIKLSYPASFIYYSNKDAMERVDDDILQDIQTIYEHTYELRKQKMSEINTITNESRSKKLKNHPVSEQTRKKISDSLKGSKRPSYNKGKVWINKDGRGTVVKPDVVNVYLEQGWVMGRPPVSEETKKKISETVKASSRARSPLQYTKAVNTKRSKGTLSLSEETKRKIGEKNRGKPSKFKGVPRSAETRAKMSRAQLGKKASIETRAKLSEKRKGKSPANKGRLYVYKVVDGKKKVKYIVSEDGPMFFDAGWQVPTSSQFYKEYEEWKETKSRG